jgi:prepilin signal peptidase PulO-like enzyme (type II secretory pathway)
MAPLPTGGRSPLREPTGPWEFLLGLLAVVSLFIFFTPYLGAIHLPWPSAWNPYLIAVDIAICVVFALDYITRMLRSPLTPVLFARQNFLQPFAMVPLNTPLISEVQLFLLVILFARFVRAFNVVFGQRAFQAILGRYSGVLAREISDAVLVRSLTTAKEITDRGRFAESIGNSLDRRRGELTLVVHETLEKTPQWQAVRRLPGTTELLARIERVVVDTVIESLRSDRLNALVGEIINDSIEDFKLALEQKHPGVTAEALGPDHAGRAP